MIPLADSLYPEGLYKISPRTTVIISTPWHQIPGAERRLLDKVLASVNLSLPAVTIVYQPVLHLSAIKERPLKVIYFGDPVKGLPQFENLTIEGASILLSTPIHVLIDDQSAKLRLWNALKGLFNIHTP